MVYNDFFSFHFDSCGLLIRRVTMLREERVATTTRNHPVILLPAAAASFAMETIASLSPAPSNFRFACQVIFSVAHSTHTPTHTHTNIHRDFRSCALQSKIMM